MNGFKLQFYKWFAKDQLVHAVVFTGDKRIRNYYRIPQGNNIHINGRTFVMNDKDFFLDKESIPTFTYHVNRTDPIDPFDTKKSVMSPEYFDTAINNKVATDIFSATKTKMDTAMIALFISFVSLIGIGIVGYLIYEIIPQINEIRDVLRTIGGV